jgi:hypothetical protein
MSTDLIRVLESNKICRRDIQEYLATEEFRGTPLAVQNCVRWLLNFLGETPKRYRLVSDSDGHRYLIEAHQEDEFHRWEDAGPYWEKYSGVDFNDCNIGGAFSVYTFENPKVEK